MNESDVKAWLEQYRQAWENRDPEAEAALFSEDARYYETPFLGPAQGRGGVRRYWTGATRNRSDVTFSYDRPRRRYSTRNATSGSMRLALRAGI